MFTVLNKSSLFALLSMLLASNTWSQNGYIITDSTYVNGFIENQGRKLNQKEVKFRKSPSSPQLTYTPHFAKEYGMGDKSYRSKTLSVGIDSSKYFLEVLSKGSVTLYVIKLDGGKRFFAENSTGLTELTKSNSKYLEQIRNLFVGCNEYEKNIQYLHFYEKSLQRFFIMYNGCYQKGPWPFTRFGIIAGLSNSSLTVTDIYGKEVSMNKNTSPFFGIALDLPVGLRPNWFLNLQLLYQQNNFTGSQITGSQLNYREKNYNIDVSSVTLPISIRYGFPLNSFRAFTSLGPSLSYTFKSKSTMVEEIGFNSSNFNTDHTELLKKIQALATVGLGLEYFVNPKISFGAEARYSVGQGLGTDGQSVSAKQLVLSVNF